MKAYNSLRKKKDEEIIELLGGDAGNIILNTSLFVAPHGEIIDVRNMAGGARFFTHEDAMAKLLADASGVSEGIEFDKYINDLLRDFTIRREWIRMGTGSRATQGMFYVLLPGYMNGNPTNAQMYAIKDFLEEAFVEKRAVVIYFDNGDSRTLREFDPEEIYNALRRYYNTGKLLIESKQKKKRK